MAHRRKRHCEILVRKALALSPLVGVLGHRQVGKTTLLELLSSHYHTMDDADELMEAQKNAKDYLSKHTGKWAAIDECQTVPELFPALKEWVRTHPKPGQFLLSGSVRFTSRKAIQESLTGRIVLFELLPMLISELRSEPLPAFWRRMITSDSFDRPQWIGRRAKEADIERYLELGGLPGICFIRETSFRLRKLDTQLETMLDRDLRKVLPLTIPYPQIRMLLQALANRQGDLVSWTELRSETEISVPTLKRLAFALEAVFLIRSVLVEGDGKGPVYFFEDVGEHAFVRTKTMSEVQQMAHLLFVHIRGELGYAGGESYRVFQYRTRAGVCVPLVIQQKENFLGVIPVEGEAPSRAENASSDSLLQRYNRSKVLFVGRTGTEPEKIGDRKLLVPVGMTV